MADRSERRKPRSGSTNDAAASRGGRAAGAARASAAEREKGQREQRLADRRAKHRQKVEAGKAKVYVVKSGDSLSKIAEKQYGDASRWPEILEANKDKIKDPNLLRPGQELRIP